MKPHARLSSAAVNPTTGGTEVTRDGQTVALSPLAAEVWSLSDGSRSVAEITDQLILDATREHVYSALDQLADNGLLESRVSPPASSSAQHVRPLVSRREVIGRLAAGVAAVTAGGALLLATRKARAQDTADATAERTRQAAAEAEATLAAENKKLAAIDKELAACNARMSESKKKKTPADCGAISQRRRRQEQRVKAQKTRMQEQSRKTR